MERKVAVPPLPLNRKVGFVTDGSLPRPRVTHRAARGKKGARFKISCGCCPESFEIYYDDPRDPRATLEIHGVNAGVRDWRGGPPPPPWLQAAGQ